MDPKSARDNKDIETDLESGLPLLGDDSQIQNSSPGTPNQGKTLFSTTSGGFVRGGDPKPSLQCNNGSNHNEVSVDVMSNTSMPAPNTVSRAEGTPVKEKRKKASSKKKAPKPPRPPQAPTLDAADYKLIKEISELAMLKRARLERMKALKKMRAAKSSSSSSSSILAMIFTVVFCIVLLIQGLSPGKSPVSTFQGSPVSTGGDEAGLISVQYQLNPSASESSAPGSESHKSFLQLVAGSDLHEKLRRNSG